MESLTSLAARVGELALARGASLATAESCTGGLIAATCTGIAGSSDWFCGGFVTYMLSAKTQMLNVQTSLLEEHGAVSEPVAHAMAVGALEQSPATVSVAVTGVAGPGGGDVTTPVGDVCLAWARREGRRLVLVQASRYSFEGDREDVRTSAVRAALEGVIQTLGAS